MWKYGIYSYNYKITDPLPSMPLLNVQWEEPKISSLVESSVS